MKNSFQIEPFFIEASIIAFAPDSPESVIFIELIVGFSSHLSIFVTLSRPYITLLASCDL